MAAPAEQETPRDRLQEFIEALRTESLHQVHAHLRELHPAEIAHVLESLPAEERTALWGLIDPEQHGAVLVHLNDEVREALIRKMDTASLVAATEGMDTDDLADILPQLPGEVIQEVMLSLEHQEREHLQSILSYPEDTAGGIMDLDTVRVRADINLDVVLRYLRRRGEIPETTDALYVVNRDGRYLGALHIRDLVTHDPELTVAEVMQREIEGIPADMPAREVANLFERRDLVTAPVIDAEGKLLGRITIDDVVDVIRDEAEHSFMSMAGLSEEVDMFAPVLHSVRRRSVWLGVNLCMALVVSSVVGLFDGTIEQVVALAVLMPVVASMGGIAGSQTLTLVIRAMALGQISGANAQRLLRKELGVGMVNGAIWALVIALVAMSWFDAPMLGLVIGSAIIVNLVVAALAGATIPLLLRKLGADPALAGSVVLTTFTDVIGFFAFLGLATVLLL